MLPKEELYRLYVVEGLSISKIRSHFKCRRSKIYESAKIHGFYNSKERIANNKIYRSEVMKGNKNGFKEIKKFVPEIKEDYENGVKIKDILRKYKINKRTLEYSRRLLGLSERDEFRFRISRSYKEILRPLFPLSKKLNSLTSEGDLSAEDGRKLFELWIDLQIALDSLKTLLKRCNRLNDNKRKKLRLSDIGITFPQSSLELKLMKILKDENIEYKSQVELRGRYFDFYIINTNLLIEVDGDWHTQETNKPFDKIAVELGYRLIRIRRKEFNDSNLNNLLERVKNEIGKSKNKEDN